MKGTRVQSIIRELRGEKIDIVEWSEDAILFVTYGLSPAKVQRVSIVDDRERVMEVVVEDKQLSLAIGKKGQNVRLAAKLTGWRIDIKSEEEKRREVEAQFGELEIPGEPSADLSAEAGDTEATPAEAEADQSEAESATAGPMVEEEGEPEAAADAEANVDGGTEPSAEGAEEIADAAAADVPVPYTLAGIGEKTVRKLVDAGLTTQKAVAAATVEQLSEIPGIGGKTAEKILAAARGESAGETNDA